MKRLTYLVTASLVLAVGLSTARAQNTRYFDVNDNGAGSGVADNNAYGWDTSSLSWNANAGGDAGTGPGQTVAWVNGDDAVFSAGTDAAGARYGLNIVAGTTARNVTIEEGTVLINGGQWNMTGVTEILAGAALESKASGQFVGTGSIKISGGSIIGSNPGSAGTIVNNLIPWEINGTGTVKYDNLDSINDNVVSIINGTIITGTGGTAANGGTGTLIKTGPDQVGYAPRDIAGVSSAAQNGFAKLRVDQGTFRLRNATINNVGGVTDERLLGAVPLAVLPDAVTLNGGGIGTSTTVTWHANRGLTVTANGGFFDNGAGASFNVPGPLTAAAGSTLTIGSPTSASTASVFIDFSNAGNATTFQGNIHMIKGILRVSTPLTAAHFDGTAFSATSFGIVEPKGGVTFTAGTDNQDASFDGRVTNYTGTGGAGTGGIFKWDGTGTLTLNPAGSEWSNTGGTIINKGTIKYGTSAAGFANGNTVTIGATAKLNMNGINDSFGGLSGPAGGVVDMNDGGNAATPGNLTLAAASGTQTYSGSITGGGNLRMGNAAATAASTATQTLAGTKTVGTVTVSAGATDNFSAGTLKLGGTTTASGATSVLNGGLYVNGTMSTTSTTVGAAGTLAGTGTLTSTVANSGIIAPGDGGVGTLHVTGNVTDASGSSWAIDLSGATADKLAVIGNIDLSGTDTLNVTGAGTGSSWIIGSYTGTQTGVFDTITSGYTVTYTGGNITLNAAAGFPGDFNGDGHVDSGDYVSIRKAFSDITTGAGLTAYNAWRTNFGVPPGSGSGLSAGSVPEPTSIVLLLSSLGFVAVGRRRTR